MTTGEALYVLAHRDMYDDETFHWAIEVVESARRQGLLP